jgi:hypothetical protein
MYLILQSGLRSNFLLFFHTGDEFRIICKEIKITLMDLQRNNNMKAKEKAQGLSMKGRISL